MAAKTFKIGLSNQDKQNMAQDVYERVLALTFAEYDSAETYNEGDFVVYNDLLYKCLEDNVTGTWDATKWQQATLQDVVDDVEDAVASVEHKANVDGNYPTMTVGMADNLTPYDESAGDDQDVPFSFQATGTGNGSQPDFSTGSAGLMKEKQGNTVVLNQQRQLNNVTDTTGNVFVTLTNQGLCTFSGTANATGVYPISQWISAIAGHKYLIYLSKEISTTNSVLQVRGSTIDSGDGSYIQNITKSTIVVWGSDYDYLRLRFYFENGQAVDDSFYCFVIDLTQWFNGDIPQELLDNPDNFFRYYQGSLAYNEGALVNADGRYIKCIGMNQWDEEWENGGLEGMGGASNVRSKNYIRVIPNGTYFYKGSQIAYIFQYDANKTLIDNSRLDTFALTTFTVSAKTVFIQFVIAGAYGTTYRNDISINLYYEDEPCCLTYEPYQILTNNDTGTEVLRSAGSVKDYKTPDGVVHRLVGTYTFTGEESWVSYGSGYRAEVLTGKEYKSIGSTIMPDNITQDTGVALNNRDSISGGADGLALSGANIVVSSTAGLVGKTINYELAEPTTEQGTQFSENLVIDDFGSMDFGGTNGVPQGALIFYPVDYKAYIDTLYKYSDGTPSNLALNSELNDKFESYLKSLSGYDASATQVLKNVEGTLTWVTEGE